MRFSERRNAPGEILNLEDQHSLLRLPDFTGLDASLALAGASPFVVVSPCGAAPLFPVPSGPRGSPLFITSLWPLRLSPPPGSGFYRFLLFLEVLLYRHLLVVLASARHFLLALRHYILAPRRVCRFPVAIPPGPSSGGPSWFLSGLRRPTLLRTLLMQPCLQVRPSCPDLSRFSVSEDTKPLRHISCNFLVRRYHGVD